MTALRTLPGVTAPEHETMSADEQVRVPVTGFDALLGLTLEERSGERVVATLQVRPDLQQPYGILHGGVLCAIVETVASVGAALWLGDRGKVVGVANHTNFLRATREGRITAEATPIHRGRTSQLWQVLVTGPDGKLAARGEVRLANVSGEQIGA